MTELGYEPDEGGYELVMPFVTVASRGGPHDDDSYAAGWECGALDARLAQMASAGLAVERIQITVHTANVAQVDLIAMKHGYRIEDRAATGDDEWSILTLVPDPQEAS